MKNINEISIIAILAIVALILVGSGAYYYYKNKKNEGATYNLGQIDSKANMPYLANVIEQTKQNTNFRKVLFTGTRSQLVVMSIPPGGEVGEETHKYTEQTLFFLSGTGKAILNGKETPVGPGDVVVVTPGTQHNFINTGSMPLKIYTVYAPPNHIDPLTEATKADADKNIVDEVFGDQPR